MNEPVSFACGHIGAAGITPCHIIQHDDGVYEARMGVACFGMTQMSEEELEACSDPFSDDFRDNYVTGKGSTEDEAVEALKTDLKQFSENLWQEK